MYYEVPKGPSNLYFQEWPDSRSLSYLKYTFNKTMDFSIKNSENKRSIPDIGWVLYFNKA